MKPCLEKYRGLFVPQDMLGALVTRPCEVDDVCNGVGSNVGWFGRLTYHLIPATIFFLDVTAAADIHDWMYTYPKTAKIDYKDEADRTFLNNMLRLIDADTSWTGRMLSYPRQRRAMTYYVAVRDFGGPSFWAGKNATYSVAYDIRTQRTTA